MSIPYELQGLIAFPHFLIVAANWRVMRPNRAWTHFTAVARPHEIDSQKIAGAQGLIKIYTLSPKRR